MEYTDENRIKDFEFFIKNYEYLYNKYGHKFHVICNEKILGTYNTFDEAMDETLKKKKIGTFLIQECNGNESAYSNYVSSWEVIV